MGRYWRKFGCEFEFSSSINELGEKVIEATRKIYGRKKVHISYKHHRSLNNKNWHVKADSTTLSELASPVSKYKDLSKICNLIEILKKNNIEITNQDSFHIHMQVSDCSTDRIITAWLQIAPIIRQCYPKYRRNSEYCKNLSSNTKTGTIARIFPWAIEQAEDHHSELSSEKFDINKTVEFRLGEATFDKKTITTFIKFFMLFLDYAKNMEMAKVLCDKNARCKSLKDVIKLLNIKSKIRDFLFSRIEKFQSR